MNKIIKIISISSILALSLNAEITPNNVYTKTKNLTNMEKIVDYEKRIYIEKKYVNVLNDLSKFIKSNYSEGTPFKYMDFTNFKNNTFINNIKIVPNTINKIEITLDGSANNDDYILSNIKYSKNLSEDYLIDNQKIYFYLDTKSKDRLLKIKELTSSGEIQIFPKSLIEKNKIEILKQLIKNGEQRLYYIDYTNNIAKLGYLKSNGTYFNYENIKKDSTILDKKFFIYNNGILKKYNGVSSLDENGELIYNIKKIKEYTGKSLDKTNFTKINPDNKDCPILNKKLYYTPTKLKVIVFTCKGNKWQK